MKDVKLLNLTLKNFKGIKDLSIDTQGGDLKIYGDNGTGKTTIFDGFVWLLFGKDSNNRADFSIKTLQAGKEIHNLEHSVTALFSIDGRRMELQKTYKEKWTKKRGAPVAEFSGHTTDFLIDGVPAKKKEFETKVSEIVDEDVFKLLTSPTYFNEALQWQDRRKILLQVCGDVEDSEVIASNDELGDLPEILSGRSIEDHRKVVAAKRAEINKELDRIPVRIDEIQRSLPETNADIESLKNQAEALEKAISENQALIRNIKDGAAITTKKQELRTVELDLESIKQKLEAASVEKANRLLVKIQEEESNIAIDERKIGDLKHNAERARREAKEIDGKLVRLREEWVAENAREFEHDTECECPTCGQSLPEEQVETARSKAQEAFNLRKSSTLEEINARGKSEKLRQDDLLKQAERADMDRERLEAQIEEKTKAVADLRSQVDALRNEVRDARQDPEYQAKLKERDALQQSIKEIEENAEQSAAGIEAEVAKLKTEQHDLNNEIARWEQVKTSQKRITELESEQRELAVEYERLERELFLTEEFIRTKVEFLEERINSKFKHARFKLFDSQINGGLKEVCETTFSGVPYSSGLNNAARINVGLDICSTLQKHYGIKVPVWIDNSESVVKLLEIDTQMISLVVSGADKELRIEPQDQTIKEAI